MIARLTLILLCGMQLSLIGCKSTSASTQKSIGGKVDDGLGSFDQVRLFSTADGANICIAQCPTDGFDGDTGIKDRANCRIGSLSKNDFNLVEANVRKSLENSGKNFKEATWNTFNKFLAPQSSLRDLSNLPEFQPIIDGLVDELTTVQKAKTNFGPEMIDDHLGGMESNPAWKLCAAEAPSSGGVAIKIPTANSDDGLNGWTSESRGIGNRYLSRKIQLGGGKWCRHSGKSMSVNVFAMRYYGLNRKPKNVPANLEKFIVEQYQVEKEPKCPVDLIDKGECPLTFVLDNGKRLPITDFNNKQFEFSGVAMMGALSTSDSTGAADDVGSGYSFTLMAAAGECAAYGPVGGPKIQDSVVQAPCIVVRDPDNNVSVCGYKEVAQ